MFEKWESNSYPHTDVKDLHRHAFQWWHATDFRVRETGPGQFRGSSASKWGLQREVDVTIRDHQGTVIVELRMRAHVTTEGVVGGGLALVLLWPVAVAGGAYSYAKYEQDALDLMHAFWAAMAAAAQASPVDHREEVLQTTAVPKGEGVSVEPPPPVTNEGTIAAEPMSAEQKLVMLEDRLARGEISEDTYKEIKARMDG